MMLSIVHLSDIHFKVGSNPIMAKLNKLVELITGESQTSDAILMIATGDIAHSGQPEEYKIATKFFSDLKTLLKTGTRHELYWYFLPGNHDCNFERNNKVRDNLLAGGSTPFLNLTTEDLSVLNSCMLHEDFFDFAKKNSNDELMIENYDRLHYRYELAIQDTKIRIHCFNTAWLSRHEEIQGRLFYPVDQIRDDQAKYDLVISAFHHPYSWLEANNARDFRAKVESLSDVILTGHEHEAEVFDKTVKTTGAVSRFVEGSVLQTNEKRESGLNIINIDLDREQWRHAEFKWIEQKQYYDCKARSSWETFVRSVKLKQQEFEPSQDFSKFLSDAGAGFTHPKTSLVRLEDIFTYPDMDVRQFEGEAEQIIYGDSFLKYVLEHSHLFITGGERSGKTALAKSIFPSALEQGLVPIYIQGDSIDSHLPEEVWKNIRKQVSKQYGAAVQDKYDQLPIGTKLLIIDDFHKVALNRKGRALLLATITKMFSKSILLGDEIFLLHELPRKHDKSETMLAYRSCHLRQFGHERRGKLIEQWCSIGEEYKAEEEEIAAEVAKKEKVINTLLGKNLMPSYPIVILSMLQSLEARESLTTASGTYGYIYEVLITAQLSRMRKLTLDTKYTLLSSLAYKLFKNKKKAISKPELDEVNKQYCDQYKMKIATDELISELEQCSMLINSDGTFRFSHKYTYYYFVAKYFQDTTQADLDVETLRTEVLGLTSQLYNEDAANIIIFYIYLTKDPFIIKAILKNAKSIFSEHEPCDMAASVKFLLATTNAPKLEYVEADPKTNKGSYLRALDRTDTPQTEDDDASISPEEKELNDVLKINVAFKTIQIMGQILRNFPGSLKGDLKFEIARETHLLGMRSLGMIMKSLQSEAETIKALVKEYLKDNRNITSEKELSKQADEFLFWFGVALGSSTIQRISYSVGSDKLEETYLDLAKIEKSVPLQLVDISIKLEHFSLPTAEIIEMNKHLTKNLYAQTILKTRVLHHFYLYYVKPQDRQQICSKLEIAVRPEAYDKATKK